MSASASGPRILVLGGKGFVGRHAVQALVALGHTPVIGTRSPKVRDDLSERGVRLETRIESDAWRDVATEFDVILNCVGILRREGAATYDKIHHLAPSALAAACKAHSCRFIQVSALGLDADNRSGFLTSKLRGERAIKGIDGDWIIVRPSLLDGEGGFGAAWLRGVAKLPLFVTPADAQGMIAALSVVDLGQALAQLCLASAQTLRLDDNRVFELGGEQAYDFAGYIHGLRRRYAQRRAIAVPIPGLLARLGAHICDVLRFSPFSFGHWELLRRNNVPQPNRLEELLGRPPIQVISVAET